MGDERITPKEYEHWLMPRLAIHALAPMTFDAATEAIVDHAREGHIRAAARTVTFRKEGELRH
jgi:hypothetical protein